MKLLSLVTTAFVSLCASLIHKSTVYELITRVCLLSDLQQIARFHIQVIFVCLRWRSVCMFDGHDECEQGQCDFSQRTQQGEWALCSRLVS